MKRVPTRRAFVIAGIGVLLILAGATAQAGWLFVLAAGVLGLVAGSFVVRHRLRSVRVERSVPLRSRVGDIIRVGLTVTNPSGKGVPLFAMKDSYPAFPETHVGVDRLAPNEVTEVEILTTGTRRGVFAGGEVHLTSAAPFGLSRSRQRLSVPSETVVVPRWVDLVSFPLIEASTGSDLMHERLRAGAGEDFLGVREFRPGDPLRAVHWRSSARAGTLVVREFEQEVSSRAALVLVGTNHGEGPGSSFEMLVSAAASIGIYALTTGHPIHMASFRDGLAEHLVDPSRNALLDWLAKVEPADGSLEPVVEEVLDRIGRRGVVVICSSDEGAAGASLDAALDRVERAGARAAVVIARSTTWSGGADPGRVPQRDLPVRMLEKDKGLAACLAG